MELKRKDRKQARRKTLKPKKNQLNQKEAFKNKERQSEKRKYRTAIKNHIKKIENEWFKQNSLQKNNADSTNLKKLLGQAQKILDKASQKGVIHKNNAARKKSKISHKINRLEKQINFESPASSEE